MALLRHLLQSLAVQTKLTLKLALHQVLVKVREDQKVCGHLQFERKHHKELVDPLIHSQRSRRNYQLIRNPTRAPSREELQIADRIQSYLDLIHHRDTNLPKNLQ